MPKTTEFSTELYIVYIFTYLKLIVKNIISFFANIYKYIYILFLLENMKTFF